MPAAGLGWRARWRRRRLVRLYRRELRRWGMLDERYTATMTIERAFAILILVIAAILLLEHFA